MGVPYINVTNSTPVSPAFPSVNNISLTQATTNNNQLFMFWPADLQSSPNSAINNNMAYILAVTPDNAATYSIVLPDATNTSVGTSFIIWNQTAHSFNLKRNDGTLLIAVGNGGAYYVYLNSNTNAGNPYPAGQWYTFPYAAGLPSITSINIVQDPSGNLIVGGIPALPLVTSGSFSFTLGNDLLALTSFGMGGVGYSARTANNTWALRQITGTANQIVSTNPQGIAGDTAISLAPNITGVDSMEIGDLLLATAGATTIATRNNAEDLILSPNNANVLANGPVKINANHPLVFVGSTANTVSFTAGATVASYAMIWPTAVPLAGQVLGATGAGPYQLDWVSAASALLPVTNNAIARFSGTTGEVQNSLVSIDNTGNVTGALSYQAINGVNALTITNNAISTNGNNNIAITPGGTGVMSFSGFALPQASALSLPANGWSAPLLSTDGINIKWAALSNKNLLVNGNFSVSKLALTYAAPNDNTYIADGWKLKSNGNGIVNITPIFANGAGPTVFNTTSNMLRISVVVPNTKFGIVQMLPNIVTQPLYSSKASFYAYAITNNLNANIKMRWVAWTNAAAIDTPDTSTMIGAWGAGGTAPTPGANWFFGANIANVTNTLAWTPMSLPGEIIANTNVNVGLFIWDDSAALNAADSVTITLTKAEPGPWYTGYYPTSYDEEYDRTSQYIQTSYPTGVAPGSGTAYSGDIAFNTPANIANQSVYGYVRFPKPLFANPAVTIYAAVTGATTNRLSNLTPGAVADYGANTAVVATAGAPAGNVLAPDTRGFSVYNNSGGAIVVGANSGFHWVANGTFF